jgi:hypothetical protein
VSKPPKPEHLLAAAATEHEIYALKALHDGKASESQQKAVLGWLIRATGVKADQFIPGQDDTRCYLLGRRSIGLQIADYVTWVPPAKPKGD